MTDGKNQNHNFPVLNIANYPIIPDTVPPKSATVFVNFYPISSKDLALQLGGANAIFLRYNPDTGTIRYRNGAM